MTRSMGGSLPETPLVWALFLMLPVACSSGQSASARDAADANDTGRTLAAKSASERALLGQVAALPSGAQREVGGAKVVAGAAYAAASGRTCRALHITEGGATQAHNRLACTDGKAWFFVPDVFGAAE